MPSQAKRQRKKQGKAARAEAIRIAQQRERRRRSAIRTAVAIVLIVGVFALIANIGGGKKKATDTTSTTLQGPPAPKPLAAGATITGDTPCPKTDGSSPRTTKFAKAPPTCIDPAKTYTATFDTSEGKIEAKLDTKGFPNTANNFIVLARYHFYDGGSFYRTDTSLNIIQGGVEPQLKDHSLPGYPLKDEGKPPFHYTAGDLVVTRGQGPDSGGADIFFTTQDDNPGLDTPGTYVIFGKVTTGLDVVKGILALNVDDLTGQIPGGGPKRVVTIKKITITES